MNSFYTTVIMKDRRFNSTHPITDVGLLEPGTRAAVARFLTAGKAAGHDLRVNETYRSQARQRQLFDQGLTQLQNVGCHGYGVAADIGLYVKGKSGAGVMDPDGQHYAFFQMLAVHVGLVSGIAWGTPKAKHTFTDWDHVQRVPVFRQQSMFAGTWYPSETYHPYADMASQKIAGIDPSWQELPA